MRQRRSLGRDLLAGAVGGVAGSIVTAVADRVLEGFISPATKRGRKSAHEVASDAFTRRFFGPGERATKLGHAAFAGLYGAGWGLVHAALRRKVPGLGRAGGLPFAIPFFLACDGAVAPLAGLAPTLAKIPWPLNAKELADHAAWTATAELVERAARRFSPRAA